MTGADSTLLADRATRSVLVNQLLFCAIVTLACVLQLLLEPAVRVSEMLLAVVLTALATGAALLVPWQRLPPLASVVLPALDIVVVGFLRHAAPNAGVGLLWTFPAMWIAWAFGIITSVVAVCAIVGVYWYSIAVDETSRVTASILLLPILIAALAFTTSVLSRRIRARGELLARQSRLLEAAARRARRHEDAMREVLDAVDFGVIRISADGDLVIANEAQSRLHQEHDHAYGPDGVTPLAADQLPLPRARRGETFEGQMIWYGDPGAERRALTVTARRLHDEDGAEAGTIVVSHDVTAEQLALRAREDLMASVSHELRTPLTSIVGYLDLALDDESATPSVARSLTIAQRNAERLLELIGDILSASAAARDGVTISIARDDADLADIVRASVEAALPRATERGIRLDATGVESVPASVDPLRIRQVVDNLLSNATKYNNDGGRIEVGCTSDGTNGWIVVRDDGPGIREQEQALLFDRFFRSSTVRNTGIHGSGLGLAISRDIARRHGGDVTVRSAPGEGATFVVRLPLTTPREDR